MSRSKTLDKVFFSFLLQGRKKLNYPKKDEDRGGTENREPRALSRNRNCPLKKEKNLGDKNA